MWIESIWWVTKVDSPPSAAIYVSIKIWLVILNEKSQYPFSLSGIHIILLKIKKYGSLF